MWTEGRMISMIVMVGVGVQMIMRIILASSRKMSTRWGCLRCCLTVCIPEILGLESKMALLTVLASSLRLTDERNSPTTLWKAP